MQNIMKSSLLMILGRYIENTVITLHLVVFFLFTYEWEVLTEKDKLSNTESPSSHGIGPKIVKNVADIIARPLAYLDDSSF
jgi:hypothetical protein